jgi:predicted dehydrogenase
MRADYWRSDPAEAPAGAMTATGVHSVDLLTHLFGRIDEVYCLSHRRVMARLEDTTAVLFGLANGMSATLHCSLVTAVSTRFAVFGVRISGQIGLSGLEPPHHLSGTEGSNPASSCGESYKLDHSGRQK